MASGYYHNPPKPATARVRCPVCHQDVYSRAGIHPQCAVKQSEATKPKNPEVVVPGTTGGPEPATASSSVAAFEPASLANAGNPVRPAH